MNTNVSSNIDNTPTMIDKLEELNSLQRYIIEQYSSVGVSLDYSVESLKQLDQLFDKEYKNGELINSASAFANREGMILTGIAGYLANVLLKNSEDSKIIIDPKDENWYLNFKVESGNGWTAQPGQRVLKRKLEGRESDFYHYGIAMIKYFTQTETNENASSSLTYTQEFYLTNEAPATGKKPWWKIW